MMPVGNDCVNCGTTLDDEHGVFCSSRCRDQHFARQDYLGGVRAR